MIGVGIARYRATPPSEPYVRISRIRLSSRWVTAERIDRPTHGLRQGSTTHGRQRKHWSGADGHYPVPGPGHLDVYEGYCASACVSNRPGGRKWSYAYRSPCFTHSAVQTIPSPTTWRSPVTALARYVVSLSVIGLPRVFQHSFRAYFPLGSRLRHSLAGSPDTPGRTKDCRRTHFCWFSLGILMV